jgi:hypothetical protein
MTHDDKLAAMTRERDELLRVQLLSAIAQTYWGHGLTVQWPFLDDTRYWQQWGGGDLSCPLCGSTVHPAYKTNHVEWHRNPSKETPR